ncbi:WD repeat-containing 92 [Brachionus plicatilis]|uniref:Dynein axonemal assembly factor 10 n=1 Tax=Brachionus plicatilis TaxID=10195 RepID=A0A3M7SYZ9_BRAPC|nr:WD repeat-containing 92 [Brachionus plicatilis]
MDKPQIILYAQKSVNFTLFDCKWIPYSAKFVLLGNHARGTGAIQIYELESGDVKLIKETEKLKAFKCGTFGASKVETRHLATGDFDGNLNIWDLEKMETPIYSVKAHKEIINAIDGVGGLGIGEGAPEIVTASRDGSVKIWDPRQKDLPVAVIEAAENETKRDAWTACFGHSYNSHERAVCSGYDNGDIKLFDLRNMCLKWEANVKNGVCCLEFDRKDIIMNKLLATTLESKIHVYDMRTQNDANEGFVKVTEKAHDSTVWLGKHLPQNREIFMTCGGGGSMYLWKYNYPSSRVTKDSNGDEMGVPGTLSLLQNVGLSSQPISGFDWSPDKLGLAVSTSFDQTVRVTVCTKLNTI